MRRFRFLADAGEITDGRTLAERARRTEALGYDVMVVPDHLLEQLAPVPALAVMAAATERLRIGSFVFNNNLRHPAVLAHELATLDIVSGGRLEIGMGAGWNRPEYDAISLPFDGVGTRVARLEEAIAVLKGCFAPGPFSVAGRFYTIAGLDLLPKPVQRPHPPIFIGGGGRRTLELAGREAQSVGLAPRILNGVTRADPRSITVAATAEKIAWAMAAAGDRAGELEFNTYPSIAAVSVTDHARAEARELAGRILSRTGVEITDDELLESPHIFIGSIQGFVDKFTMLREQLGISSFLLGDPEPLAPVVERLAGG